jgi:hypothetical protein
MVTFMNAINETVRAIASRHVADSDEGGRTCLACGRPWPCDVRQIVAALAADTPRKSAPSLRLTSPAARRVPTVSTTRVRRRVPAAPTAAS